MKLFFAMIALAGTLMTTSIALANHPAFVALANQRASSILEPDYDTWERAEFLAVQREHFPGRLSAPRSKRTSVPLR